MRVSETIQSLLGDMQAQAARAQELGHWERARSLNPLSASLLHAVVRAMHRPRILEIGTSVGFSTIFLALAAQETGGHVTTLELLPAKYEAARANLARAGLADVVTQHLGDALMLLPTLPGPWDVVFLDAEKELYVDAWHLFKHNVRPGGLVVADNVVSHADGLQSFVETVQADTDYSTVTVPIGRGLEFASRRK